MSHARALSFFLLYMNIRRLLRCYSRMMAHLCALTILGMCQKSMHHSFFAALITADHAGIDPCQGIRCQRLAHVFTMIRYSDRDVSPCV